MKPAIYTNRRPNGCAVDPIKTHLRTEWTEPRCGHKPSAHQPIRLTTELEKVTCGRCKALVSQELARANRTSNDSVSEGEQ